jgi:hypothetical protein
LLVRLDESLNRRNVAMNPSPNQFASVSSDMRIPVMQEKVDCSVKNLGWTRAAAGFLASVARESVNCFHPNGWLPVGQHFDEYGERSFVDQVVQRSRAVAPYCRVIGTKADPYRRKGLWPRQHEMPVSPLYSDGISEAVHPAFEICVVGPKHLPILAFDHEPSGEYLPATLPEGHAAR